MEVAFTCIGDYRIAQEERGRGKESCFFIIIYNILKFRKWFKNGLKAQKLLAQGIALGIIAISKAPCKGKSLIYCLDF